VSGDWPEIVEGLRLDFAWFQAAPRDRADVEVEIQQRPSDFDAFGDVLGSGAPGMQSESVNAITSPAARLSPRFRAT
jgi:hypothetical protein